MSVSAEPSWGPSQSVPVPRQEEDSRSGGLTDTCLSLDTGLRQECLGLCLLPPWYLLVPNSSFLNLFLQLFASLKIEKQAALDVKSRKTI